MVLKTVKHARDGSFGRGKGSQYFVFLKYTYHDAGPINEPKTISYLHLLSPVSSPIASASPTMGGSLSSMDA
jgi:hypothetical protein